MHIGDIPSNIEWGDSIAIDSEAMGLNNERDRLCVVQLSSGNGDAHLVHFRAGEGYAAPNLKALLANNDIEKILHFARFDVAIIRRYLGVLMQNIYCTKIASKLCRTYTDRHGLKELCKEVAGVDISKAQQSSDWGTMELSESQVTYAATDVLYLHTIRDEMKKRLEREGRTEIAREIMSFLPTRAELDLMGWVDKDIFSHAA